MSHETPKKNPWGKNNEAVDEAAIQQAAAKTEKERIANLKQGTYIRFKEVLDQAVLDNTINSFELEEPKTITVPKGQSGDESSLFTRLKQEAEAASKLLEDQAGILAGVEYEDAEYYVTIHFRQ